MIKVRVIDSISNRTFSFPELSIFKFAEVIGSQNPDVKEQYLIQTEVDQKETEM
jgi:hypothetical protein